MEKENNPIYERNTLEFVTVALEFCTFVETAGQNGLFDFIDKGIKLLPLLYLKATLLPEAEVDDEDDEPELTVTEDSDTPIAAFVSENLADVYQDTGNFVSLFRQGNEEVMLQAIALCRANFQEFWGQQLLNALKALHAIRYSDEEIIETNEE